MVLAGFVGKDSEGRAGARSQMWSEFREVVRSNAV